MMGSDNRNNLINPVNFKSLPLLPMIVAAATGATATGLCIYIMSPVPKKDAPRPQNITPSPKAPTPVFPTLRKPSPTTARPVLTEAQKPTSTTNSSSGTWPPLLPHRKPADTIASPLPPTEKELARQASKVEHEANLRLAHYTSNLGLTEAQQDAIFPLLAKASPSYFSTMLIEGANPKTTPSGILLGENVATPTTGTRPSLTKIEEEIYNILDGERQDELAQQVVERDDWWADIINFLDQDSTTPAEDDAPPAITASETTLSNSSKPETPAAHQGTNLFDILNNAN